VNAVKYGSSYFCLRFKCNENVCEELNCGTHSRIGRGFNLIDFREVDKYSRQVAFFKELTELMGVPSTSVLKNEISKMIQNNETLKSRGFI